MSQFNSLLGRSKQVWQAYAYRKLYFQRSVSQGCLRFLTSHGNSLAVRCKSHCNVIVMCSYNSPDDVKSVHYFGSSCWSHRVLRIVIVPRQRDIVTMFVLALEDLGIFQLILNVHVSVGIDKVIKVNIGRHKSLVLKGHYCEAIKAPCSSSGTS